MFDERNHFAIQTHQDYVFWITQDNIVKTNWQVSIYQHSSPPDSRLK